MEIAAFFLSVLALLLSAWALWNARWAAVNSGRPTRRVRRRASAERRRPQFRLEHVSRHRYVLHNDGSRPAYDVRVETGDLSVHEGSVAFDQFRPRQSEQYLLIQPLQGRVNEITVTWYPRPGGRDQPAVTRLPLDSQVVPVRDDQET